MDARRFPGAATVPAKDPVRRGSSSSFRVGVDNLLHVDLVERECFSWTARSPSVLMNFALPTPPLLPRGGRLSLRMLPGIGVEDGEWDAGQSHVAALERTDEYLVLLKRLWSNERPFDHEGPFYRLRDGYVPNKGPQASVPIRMSGLSGTALKVAGRHADIFELAPGTPQEVGQVIERVRVAAAEFGRAGLIRFALPVWFDWTGNEPSSGHHLARSSDSAAIPPTQRSRCCPTPRSVSPSSSSAARTP